MSTVNSQLSSLITQAGGSVTDTTKPFYTPLSVLTAQTSNLGAAGGQALNLTGNQSNADTVIANLTSTTATGPGCIPGPGCVGSTNTLGQFVGLFSATDGAISQLTAALSSASMTPAPGPSYPTVEVLPASPRLGDISIVASSLSGSGSLLAPGNASVKIINNTAATLTVDSMTFPTYESGIVRFNGILVNSNSDINALQSGGGANFSNINTGTSSGTPTVTITSNYYSGDLSYYNPSSSLPYLNTLEAPPDIQINANQTISNPKGAVNITSAAGDIFVNGAIDGGQVTILAKNGDFVSSYEEGFDHVGGDPASGLTVGGGVTANGSVSISARYLDINSTIQSGIANLSLTLPTLSGLTLETANYADIGVSPGSLTTYDSQYATALQANANANPIYTIASGLAYNAQTKQLQFSYNYASTYVTGHSSSTGIFGVLGAASLGANYNFNTGEYDVNNAQVSGGFVQLYGQIIDTSGTGTGQINALDGFGNINIVNQSTAPVVLGTLNTGVDPNGNLRGTAGVIDITDVRNVDTSTSPASVSLLRTVYTRGLGGVVVQDQSGYINSAGAPTYYAPLATIAAPGGISSSSGYVDATRASQYDPAAGLRYNYTTATSNDQKIDISVSNDAVFGVSAFTFSTNTSFNVQDAHPTSTTQLLNGSYLTTANDITYTGTTQENQGIVVSPPTTGISCASVFCFTNGSAFIESKQQLTKTVLYVTNLNAPGYLTSNGSTTSCGFLCITETTTNYYTVDQQFTAIATTSVKADNPIAINFIGSNTGALNVNSVGNVVVAGTVTSKGGAANICAGGSCVTGFTGGASSIIQGSKTGSVTGLSVDLVAAGSVGGQTDPNNPAAVNNAPLAVVLSAVPGQDPTGSLTATAADGVVTITSAGELRVQTVTASGGPHPAPWGNVTLYADGSIVAAASNAYIQGDTAVLTSVNGSIGSVSTPLTVNTGLHHRPDLSPVWRPGDRPVSEPQPILWADGVGRRGDIGIKSSGLDRQRQRDDPGQHRDVDRRQRPAVDARPDPRQRPGPADQPAHLRPAGVVLEQSEAHHEQERLERGDLRLDAGFAVRRILVDP